MKIPFGVSRAGEIWRDIRRFPHLLVAGQTGGGKSNFLHCLITNLTLYNNCKIFIIDMKRMEFNIYEDHAEVAYKLDHAYRVLKYLRQELDRRMDLLSSARVNNINKYKGLDYYFLVVDEFSQLSPILATSKEEKEIRKLCHQYLIDLICLARAVGIHIILATQRPDRDILPGQLKANIPATLCFKVRNVTNSLICLDNDKAAYLPNDIPGRAIFQWDIEREVQTYLIANPKTYLPNQYTTKPIIEQERQITTC